jgi:hypothetical protein
MHMHSRFGLVRNDCGRTRKVERDEGVAKRMIFLSFFLEQVKSFFRTSNILLLLLLLRMYILGRRLAAFAGNLCPV